jgi:hypothetical protein
MFEPTRDQAREFFFETWRKYRAREILSGLEALALQIALMHPEYQSVLDEPERYREQEYFPELGQTNPFLHLSLHLALEEQLSIDQPKGIVARFAALAARRSEHHAALHDALECLAETVWRAQSERAEPDGAAYLACLEARARR